MKLTHTRLPLVRAFAALSAASMALVGGVASCAELDAAPRAAGVASASGQAVAVSLGNLRVGRVPSKSEAVASEILFGTLPETALNFVKPVDLREAADGLVVADGGLAAILFWNAESRGLAFAALRESTRAISALTVAPGGDVLIADAGAAAALRLSSRGDVMARYKMPGDDAFRPAGLAAVGSELWVSNAAGHRIEVFNIESGAFQKSIGRRGRGNGEFGIPLGIAVLADGNVGVVDMLNCRVQVLSPGGGWVRSIGGPGDVPGRFGRPRTIAAGPDGTIFVTDAASQRVHAFSSDGRVIGVFGGDEPPLVLPAGIAVVHQPPPCDRVPADAESIHYYVLVAEQMLRPGVRVYGWRGETSTPAATVKAPPKTVRPSQVSSPHWSPTGCTQCHETASGGGMSPIAADQVDRLCLSCHDGIRASDEAHPIGRAARGPQTQVPKGWPLNDGRLGCLTCHEMQRHCDAGARRPATNPSLVRGYEHADPLASCRNCHVAQEWRINPHRTTENSSCAFCHTTTPDIRDGQRSGNPRLHVNDSRVCLGCHAPHADPAPRGHLGAQMTDVLVMNLSRTRGAITKAVAHASAANLLLPFSENQVACYTCHNPHAPELFEPTTDLGRRAGGDDPFDLRLPYAALCIACHGK